MIPTHWKTVFLKAVKIIISLIALYYLYQVFQNNFDVFIQSKPDSWWKFGITTLCNVLLYVLLLFFLAWSWVSITETSNSLEFFKIYLKSQIYKYIPSNLMHFVYRHKASKNAGLSNQTLIQATISESISLVAAALLMAMLIYFLPSAINTLEIYTSIILILCIHLTLWIFSIFTLLYKNNPINVFKCYTGHMLYFLGMGIIGFWMGFELAINGVTYIQLAPIFAIAWLCGYLIPGAPGGLGVREAVFVFLSGNIITPSQALILIASIRVICLTGEVLVFWIAQFINSNQQDHQA